MIIYLVDDDPVARLIALDELDENSHKVRELPSGDALLAALQEGTPDLILLDIEMPGMNGIDVCRALRASGHTNIPVVFISARDDLDTRLMAYEAGGSDFIVKPYAAKELARKVLVAEQALSRDLERASQTQLAHQAAFTAMSELGETGVVLHFLRSSFACNDAEQLATELFGALAEYGLQGLVEFRAVTAAATTTTAQQFSSRGACTPLEASILGHARSMDHVFKFHDRLTINYPAITLLALDLPVTEPDRVGRLTDHLSILAEGANAKMLALQTDAQRQVQADGIYSTVGDLSKTLADIDVSQSRNRLAATEINSEFLQELTRAFVRLGLSEEQERTLTAIAEGAQGRLNSLMDADRGIGDHLRAIEQKLRGLTRGST